VTAGRSDVRRLLVLGGTSEIGLAIAAEMAAAGARDIALVGRDRNGLALAGDQLRARGAERVEALALDARESREHGAVLRTAFSLFGGFDAVVLAVGVLGARGGLPEDIESELDVLLVNAVGAGSLLLHSARLLAEHGGGTIVVLSSVAGIRPRRTNAVYGASKAALDGLSPRLRSHEDDARPGAGAAEHDAGEGRVSHPARPAPRGTHGLGPRRTGARDDARAGAAATAVSPSLAMSRPDDRQDFERPLTEPRRARARIAVARRGRRMRQADVAIGLAVAAIVTIVTPGLAPVALLAVLILVVVLLSFAVGTRRRRRRGGRQDG
jgi:NADP-dependent 3-hydroxy acid dehydrogenase YdfG